MRDFFFSAAKKNAAIGFAPIDDQFLYFVFFFSHTYMINLLVVKEVEMSWRMKSIIKK